MSAVKIFAAFNIPKVLVSAILPPVLLPRLLKACWISEVTEIRVPVTSNLAKYSVISSCTLVDKEGANGYNLPDIVQEMVRCLILGLILHIGLETLSFFRLRNWYILPLPSQNPVLVVRVD